MKKFTKESQQYEGWASLVREFYHSWKYRWDACSSVTGYWKSNLGLLKEYQVLLTAVPLLQILSEILNHIFYLKTNWDDSGNRQNVEEA